MLKTKIYLLLMLVMVSFAYAQDTQQAEFSQTFLSGIKQSTERILSLSGVSENIKSQLNSFTFSENVDYEKIAASITATETKAKALQEKLGVSTGTQPTEQSTKVDPASVNSAKSPEKLMFIIAQLVSTLKSEAYTRDPNNAVLTKELTGLVRQKAAQYSWTKETPVTQEVQKTLIAVDNIGELDKRYRDTIDILINTVIGNINKEIKTLEEQKSKKDISPQQIQTLNEKILANKKFINSIDRSVTNSPVLYAGSSPLGFIGKVIFWIIALIIIFVYLAVKHGGTAEGAKGRVFVMTMAFLFIVGVWTFQKWYVALILTIIILIFTYVICFGSKIKYHLGGTIHFTKLGIMGKIKEIIHILISQELELEGLFAKKNDLIAKNKQCWDELSKGIGDDIAELREEHIRKITIERNWEKNILQELLLANKNIRGKLLKHIRTLSENIPGFSAMLSKEMKDHRELIKNLDRQLYEREANGSYRFVAGSGEVKSRSLEEIREDLDLIRLNLKKEEEIILPGITDSANKLAKALIDLHKLLDYEESILKKEKEALDAIVAGKIKGDQLQRFKDIIIELIEEKSGDNKKRQEEAVKIIREVTKDLAKEIKEAEKGESEIEKEAKKYMKSPQKAAGTPLRAKSIEIFDIMSLKKNIMFPTRISDESLTDILSNQGGHTKLSNWIRENWKEISDFESVADAIDKLAQAYAEGEGGIMAQTTKIRKDLFRIFRTLE
ncbi:hypothetical protein JXB27_02500 [Candidatus Woesearchaeota archaeon]|nr:hypothetical protein [Candidatus Woesearchaeota archaeon]